MLSDRQAVILHLLTASVQAGHINPFFLSRLPADLLEQELEKLALIADAFLTKTASPFNALSMASHLEQNTTALMEISNALEKVRTTLESNSNGHSPHEMS